MNYMFLVRLQINTILIFIKSVTIVMTCRNNDHVHLCHVNSSHHPTYGIQEVCRYFSEYYYKTLYNPVNAHNIYLPHIWNITAVTATCFIFMGYVCVL